MNQTPFNFFLKKGSTAESLSTAASKGTIVPVPNDKWLWSIGVIKTGREILLRCHFVHHNSHMNYPWIKCGPWQWEASNFYQVPIYFEWGFFCDTCKHSRMNSWTVCWNGLSHTPPKTLFIYHSWSQYQCFVSSAVVRVLLSDFIHTAPETSIFALWAIHLICSI